MTRSHRFAICVLFLGAAIAYAGEDPKPDRPPTTPPVAPPGAKEVAAKLPAAAASRPADRTPVPGAKQQLEARKLVRDVFKGAFAQKGMDERKALAQKLINEGVATSDDATSRYVLFSEGVQLGVELGDAELLLQGIASIDRYFNIDALAMKRDLLAKASRNMRVPDQFKALARAYMSAAEDLAGKDNYMDASRLLKQAEQAAMRGRSVPLLTKIRSRSRTMTTLQRDYLQIKNLRKKLEQNPEDPRANRTVGEFLCFKKGKWADGMAHLALSGDKDLKDIAALELGAVDSAAKKAALGDKWWQLAGKTRDKIRSKAMLDRGTSWYCAAAPDLKGLAQVRVNKKIESLFGGARIWDMQRTRKKGEKLGGTTVNIREVMTIEFWMCTEADEGPLLTKRTDPLDGSITFSLRDGCLQVIGDAPKHLKHGASQSPVNDGVWHHVAAVKSGLEVKVFVDGRRQQSFETRSTFTSRTPWVLGHHGPWKQEGIDCRFCKIRISKTARYNEDFRPQWDYLRDEATLLMK